MKKAKGKIKEIDDNEIVHLASTNSGSSGSPLFLENTIKVIGIHKQSNNESTENYDDFIYPIFDIIINDLKPKNKNVNKPKEIKKIKKMSMKLKIIKLIKI